MSENKRGRGRPKGCKSKYNSWASRLHDGYGIHDNPDGSFVFIEGIADKQGQNGHSPWLTIAETRNLNACCKRRGIETAFSPWTAAVV